MQPPHLVLLPAERPAQERPVAVASSPTDDPAVALTPPSPGRPPAPRHQPAAPFRRREHPWLLVAVDTEPTSHAALVWALREAARREATVLAVSVRAECCDGGADGADPWDSIGAHGALLAELDDRVRAATAEAGVRPRVRTAVLDAPVFDALAGAARGADLVVVGPHSKTLLRAAVARTTPRRVAHPA